MPGLPNPMSETGFDETPDVTSSLLGEFRGAPGSFNIAGGCCGTTPAHIRAVRRRSKAWRREDSKRGSGDAALRAGAAQDRRRFVFVNIGERTNVTGSKAFRTAGAERKYEEAVAVARQQVENGAQLIDVTWRGDARSARAMTRFLNLIASEPDIARYRS